MFISFFTVMLSPKSEHCSWDPTVISFRGHPFFVAQIWYLSWKGVNLVDLCVKLSKKFPRNPLSNFLDPPPSTVIFEAKWLFSELCLLHFFTVLFSNARICGHMNSITLKHTDYALWEHLDQRVCHYLRIWYTCGGSFMIVNDKSLVSLFSIPLIKTKSAKHPEDRKFYGLVTFWFPHV